MLARLIIILSLFFSGFGVMIGQNCSFEITGSISDVDEFHPLEFATVFIQETRQWAQTDTSGMYSIQGVCKGMYHFVLSHIGCESQTFFIQISGDTTLDFSLQHSHHLLEEVNVSARDFNSRAGLVKNTISSDLLVEMSGKSVSDIVRTVPGVTSLKSGPGLSKPVINGMYGNRVTILNNGIPQEGQQWGIDHAPEIDPAANDKVTVVRGPAAIRYGLQAVGGIITVEPKMLVEEPHLHGTVKITGQSNGRAAGANTTLKKSFGPVNARLFAGINHGGDKFTPGYYLTNTGTRESGLSLLLANSDEEKQRLSLYYSYFHATYGILRGSHIGNLTDLKEALTREIPFFTSDSFSYAVNPPKQQVDHHLIKYRHIFTPDERSRLELNAAVQANYRKEFDVRRAGRSEKPALNLLLFSQYYDLLYLMERSKWSLGTGLQFRNGNNTNQPGTGISPLIPDYLSYTAAWYNTLRKEIKNVSLEAGIRTEYRHYDVYLLPAGNAVQIKKHNFLNFASNIGLRKAISEKTEVSVDLSYTQRPPEINELYSNGLHQSVSGIEEGDASLRPESSWKIINEWVFHPGNDHHVNLSVFYHYVSQYIYLEPTNEVRLTIRGAFPLFRYTGADVRLAGISGKWSAALSKYLSLNSTFSYLNARNISMQTGLVRMPPFTAMTQLLFTSGKTKLYNELKTGLEVSYTGRQTNVSPEEDFTPPPPGYTLVNANLRVRWKKSSHRDLELLIRCDNVLNLAYRDYLNRLRYFADEQGRSFYFTLFTNF